MLLLYATCDAGDYWKVTFDLNFTEDLSMVPARSDSSVYFWTNKYNETIADVTETNVDDFLNADAFGVQRHTDLSFSFGFYALQIKTEHDELLTIF